MGRLTFSLEKSILAFTAAYTFELKKSLFGWLKRTGNSKDKYLTFKMPFRHPPEATQPGPGGVSEKDKQAFLPWTP